MTSTRVPEAMPRRPDALDARRTAAGALRPGAPLRAPGRTGVRPELVIDRTSLQERFDLELEWAPDVFPQLPLLLGSPDRPATGRLDSSAPSIFTAVREQLGLSLEPSRGEVEVFVIDRAERPTSN